MRNAIRAILAVAMFAGMAGAADANWRVDVFAQGKSPTEKSGVLKWQFADIETSYENRTVVVSGAELPGILVKRDEQNKLVISLGGETVSFRIGFFHKDAVLACGKDKLYFSDNGIRGTVLGQPVSIPGDVFVNNFYGEYVSIVDPAEHVLTTSSGRTDITLHGWKSVVLRGNLDAVAIRASAYLAAAQARLVFVSSRF